MAMRARGPILRAVVGRRMSVLPGGVHIARRWRSGAWTGPPSAARAAASGLDDAGSRSHWPNRSSPVRRRPVAAGVRRGWPQGISGAVSRVHVVTRCRRAMPAISKTVRPPVATWAAGGASATACLCVGARCGPPTSGPKRPTAERLVDAVASAAAEGQAGIRDQMPTAVFPNGGGVVAPRQRTHCFCPPLSIRQLATEPSMAATWPR